MAETWQAFLLPVSPASRHWMKRYPHRKMFSLVGRDNGHHPPTPVKTDMNARLTRHNVIHYFAIGM